MLLAFDLCSDRRSLFRNKLSYRQRSMPLEWLAAEKSASRLVRQRYKMKRFDWLYHLFE